MASLRPTHGLTHDDGVDRWGITRAAPAAALRGRVGGYVSYWEETASFVTRRELAAGEGVLIYALGDPLEIVGADGHAIVLQAGEAFVGGIADATSLSRGLGPQDGIHIHLPLASLAAAIGAPVGAIANQVVPLADLIGRDADALGGRLCDSADPDTRFDLLDAFFARRFAAATRDERLIAWAAPKLARAQPAATSALAAEIGWSRQHFTRRFRDAAGFSPDRYRRVARFQRFAAALTAHPGDSLAGLAVDAGYVDQAHLTRDVRDFAAMTPGELRARLIPGAGGVRDD